MPDRRFVSQLGHNEQVQQVFLASEKQLRPNATATSTCRSTCATAAGRSTPACGTPARTTTAAFENGDFVQVDGVDAAVPGQHADDRHAHPPGPARRGARGGLRHAADRPTSSGCARGCWRSWRTIKSPPLARLVKAFTDDEAFMDKFCRAPAAMKNHHAYKGGLLEHVVSLMELVLRRGAAVSAARRRQAAGRRLPARRGQDRRAVATTARSATPTSGR